ncbi:hypothetical protein CR513_10287, partial [Mucuna pruriens]
MPKNRSQNSEARYKTRETTSRRSKNDHRIQNSTQNEFLIPMPKYVQRSQFPSTHSLTVLEKVQQQRHMRSHNRTRLVGCHQKKMEYGVKAPIKQKRYRKLNVKKNSSAYQGVTRCKGRFESFVWDNDPTARKKGKTS